MAVAEPVVVILSTVAVVAAVRLLLRYLKFRKLELAIPGPPSLPLIGNTLDFVGLSMDTVLSTLMRVWGGRHSELSRFNLAGHLMVFVTDPDHLQELFRRKDLLDKDKFFYGFLEPVQNGLVTLNGPAWRAHRKALTPAFHQSVLDRYTSVFSVEALGFVHRLLPGEVQVVTDNLLVLNVRAFMMTTIAASKSEEPEVERALPDIKSLVMAVSHAFSYRCFQPWLWPNAVFGLTPTGRTIRDTKARMDAYARSVIASRRAKLEQERAEGCVGDGDPAEKRRPLISVMVESLADEEIICEAYEMAGAAIDTTAATLGWVLKALSLKQDVQQRLLQEVEEVLGEDAATRTATITSDELNRLEYTERVIKETLRLLPATPIVARVIKEQTELGGHTLPAGTTLIVNIVGAHRHPGHWPDPMRFDPDRFLPENSEGRHPCAFVAFSAGPRNCLGSRYAMMLMKTLLATLVPRYRVDPVAGEDYKEPAEFPMASGLASRMVGDARVVYTPRVGCAA